jgi:hypothetical protein
VSAPQANTPACVQKLATALLLRELGIKSLLRMSAQDAAALAETFGIPREELIAAFQWLDEYHEARRALLELEGPS